MGIRQHNLLSSRAASRRRSICAFLCGIVVLGVAFFAQAETTEILLKNGAVLQADVLQRTPERLVLDLGYMVLTIPADQVETEGKGSVPTTTLKIPVSDVATSSTVAAPIAISSVRRPVGAKGRVDFRDIVDDLEGAVVIVSNPSGMGAGFFVDPSGLVVTNHHVVRGERYNDITWFRKTAQGKIEKKIFKRVEVQAYSMLLDCALLKIPPQDLEGIELPYLNLADPKSLKTSLKVYALGNPAVGAAVLDHTLSQGIISSTNRNFNDVLYLQTTAAVNPGNSGGPLLNEQGEVVGLVTFRAFFQEGVAFALPVSYLRGFLDNAKAYAPTQDTKNTGYRYHDPMK